MLSIKNLQAKVAHFTTSPKMIHSLEKQYFTPSYSVTIDCLASLPRLHGLVCACLDYFLHVVLI